ncbi:heavy metal translocating P-type ATPase [Spartinivicinus poritis]|uniref:Heavy metal translocating P-type ATPase n=1 Tax=Spartinivicinus poritis TaxID=2994640 RepID=A0ABT5UC85_9GAMM|nr:heavy metal translocating P-type ATPase [Spartinivicinus sp. A2-2]MDE1463937.1 heavy metal translocating P-type ATPase [Spartinivicinus sp. A2-2]
MAQLTDCFHCGTPITAGSTTFFATIAGEQQPMCCPACQTVAEAIDQGGLSQYYQYRTNKATKAEANAQQFQVYDEPALQDTFVKTLPNGDRTALLLLENIHCAACIWLIEQHLQQFPAVKQATVNFTQHQLQLSWDAKAMPLSQLMAALQQIGYPPLPFHPNQQQSLMAKRRRKMVRQLAVAGIGAMQVMMYAVALYAGTLQGIAEQHQWFLRWVSFIVTTPVVFYAAKPFFQTAWRDIRTRQLSMDVPIALAIGGAYSASSWAMLTNSGEVYFDSVCMFTFFLLLGRFVEFNTRQRAHLSGYRLNQLLPDQVTLITEGKEAVIPLTLLKPADTILVKPGATIPADGTILAGQTTINEATLTGEFLPEPRQVGDQVIAGSINVDQPIQVQITHTGPDTQLACIEQLLNQAQQDKPPIALLANKVAHYFVASVLVIASLVFFCWWQLAPEDALWVTLSVLVVTCPCALSLATPTALTAATYALQQQGFIITKGHLLEGLTTINHIVFDKTGTLTTGQFSLTQVIPIAAIKTDQAMALAAALEIHSEHPIAKAFPASSALQAVDITNTPGQGISGTIDGTNYRIGIASHAWPAEIISPPSHHGHWLLLADDQQPIAWFEVNDSLREEAADTIAALQQQGFTLSLLTGDRSTQASNTAHALTIHNLKQGASPEDKLAYINALQDQGDKVLMVGDGVNDAPVLAAADVSVAMGSATDLAKTHADGILLNGKLATLLTALTKAQKTRQIIRGNLIWSLTYNVVALPLAALGMIPPWAAAIGMTSSSLVVVLNALRLSAQQANQAQPDTTAKSTWNSQQPHQNTTGV